MVEKLENMMKKKTVLFSRKKRFHLLKLHLYQIGKAQKIPAVAGRLVTISVLLQLKCWPINKWSLIKVNHFNE